jgi:hypothetical protein
MGGLVVQMGIARWNIIKKNDRVNKLVTEHNVLVTSISLKYASFPIVV